ncbi:MAG: ABC transporter ATP-binding protein [candidate division Zixibacteria bacterium]|nr:ABC transporter ATP-binding protein [candidate division Zixibacteria bacterium]
MPELILKNVSKSFGATKVLENVSLSLADGELLVLLGPSGCGKTTILRLIAGLETMDRGQIFLGEMRIDQMRPRDRQVAMVFQNYALYPHLTVEKNLAFPLKVAGVARGEIRRRVRETAQMLGLGDRMQERPSALSGGQRQRVALGRAIIREPNIFLLDEPLSNLDADLRARMRRDIVRLQKELNVTTVYVTHDQIEALTMADRIAILHEGRLLQVGTPEQLYRNPDCLKVAEFIGQPRLNVISCENIKTAGDMFACEHSISAELQDSGPVIVGIRPEAIHLNESEGLRGEVIGCEYLGNYYVVTLGWQDRRLTVSGCKSQLPIGQTLGFSIAAEDILLFSAATGRRIRP